MSSGNLCGHKIKVSKELNSENTIELNCDLYENHEGEHSKMIYHCADIPNDKIFKVNFRMGRINWMEKEHYIQK